MHGTAQCCAGDGGWAYVYAALRQRRRAAANAGGVGGGVAGAVCVLQYVATAVGGNVAA